MDITAAQGDITTASVDCIVNAANSSLLGGGGVDGAIHRAAGPDLLAACQELRKTSHPNGLPVGEAVATPGFKLPAQWVVHTVGPNRHRGQTDPALLASCVHSSCRVARGIGAETLAFPAISAGAYGWAARDVADILVSAAREEAHHGDLREIRFVLFNDSLTENFLAALGGSDV